MVLSQSFLDSEQRQNLTPPHPRAHEGTEKGDAAFRSQQVLQTRLLLLGAWSVPCFWGSIWKDTLKHSAEGSSTTPQRKEAQGACQRRQVFGKLWVGLGHGAHVCKVGVNEQTEY